MSQPEINQQCKTCGSYGTGNYCSSCGQSFLVKRLTLKSMLHETFHFFTHFDKGFPYTLKKLVVSPGKMQREYIDGVRAKYQKPFSMFFLCASFTALALYWINTTLVTHFNNDNSEEVVFFHHYWVILQVCMLPVYSLITYFFFKESGLNYAEIMVFQLYMFSFMFLMLTIIHLLKFIFPHLQTRYIELPAIILYGIITNIHFFDAKSKWFVVLKSILVIALSFFMAAFIQDQLVGRI